MKYYVVNNEHFVYGPTEETIDFLLKERDIEVEEKKEILKHAPEMEPGETRISLHDFYWGEQPPYYVGMIIEHPSLEEEGKIIKYKVIATEVVSDPPYKMYATAKRL